MGALKDSYFPSFFIISVYVAHYGRNVVNAISLSLAWIRSVLIHENLSRPHKSYCVTLSESNHPQDIRSLCRMFCGASQCKASHSHPFWIWTYELWLIKCMCTKYAVGALRRQNLWPMVPWTWARQFSLRFRGDERTNFVHPSNFKKIPTEKILGMVRESCSKISNHSPNCSELSTRPYFAILFGCPCPFATSALVLHESWIHWGFYWIAQIEYNAFDASSLFLSKERFMNFPHQDEQVWEHHASGELSRCRK